MNTVTVHAHGSPGSFARKVQHNPQIAIDLLTANNGLIGGAGGAVSRVLTRAIEAGIEGATEAAAEFTKLRRQATTATESAHNYQHPED